MTTAPESRTVEFYFDVSSPYSYLASTRIEAICSRHGAGLVWRPILLGPIFKRNGATPLFQRPGAGAHALVDLERWASYQGVPYKPPPVFPINGLTAARGFVFARDAGKGGEYCRRVLEACWGEGRDLGLNEEVAAVAAQVGLDGKALLESTQRREVKEWLRGEVDRAIERGVFGAPTFFLGDDLFHGNDRLFMLEIALGSRSAEEGGPAPGTPFNRWFGIRLVEREKGRTVYEVEVTGNLTNQRGVAHGGVVTSLLDTAMGSAVVSAIAPEEWCATLELSVQFREPVWPGRITARGRMVKRGRHAAFAEGEVVDPSGKILAQGHGTWYIWPGRPER